MSMLIKRRRGWELLESAATPEDRFQQRRRLLRVWRPGRRCTDERPLNFWQEFR
jgi:hypothetical protein